MPNIQYQFISSEEFYPFFFTKRSLLFDDNFDFNSRATMTDAEIQKFNELKKGMENAKEYYLVALEGENIIGWSFGMQQSASDFYMINSAVLPEYRQQGIYTKLLETAITHLKDLGFQHIFSRHKMSNNAILIAKLKYGFVISGIEINDQFGPMVRLSYYPNIRRMELLNLRMGLRKPTQEDLDLIQK